MNLQDVLQKVVIEGRIDTEYPARLAKRLEEDPLIKAISQDVWQAVYTEIQLVVNDDSINATLKRHNLISADDRKAYSTKIALPLNLQPYAMHLSAELETRGHGDSTIILPHMTIVGQASTRRGTVTCDDQGKQDTFRQEHLGWRILRPESVDIEKITKNTSNETRRNMMIIIAHMWNATIYNAGQHIVEKNSLPS